MPDWTTSQDGDAMKSQISSQDELTQIRRHYGIQANKWAWPYRLSASDVDLLSDDERKYLEQEFGVVMPSNKEEEDGHIIENTKSLASDIALDNNDFIAPDSFRVAATRQWRRRLTAVDAPAYDERQLRGKKPKSTSEDGVIANRSSAKTANK